MKTTTVVVPDFRVQIRRPDQYVEINEKGTVLRRTPKVRGKASAKAAKRLRQRFHKAVARLKKST